MSSGRRITLVKLDVAKADSGKLDVTEADFEKVGCGEGFELDSGSYGLLGKSS